MVKNSGTQAAFVGVAMNIIIRESDLTHIIAAYAEGRASEFRHLGPQERRARSTEPSRPLDTIAAFVEASSCHAPLSFGGRR